MVGTLFYIRQARKTFSQTCYLNPNQIAYLRGKRYENEKNIKSFKGNQYSESGSGKTYPHQNREKYTWWCWSK